MNFLLQDRAISSYLKRIHLTKEILQFSYGNHNVLENLVLLDTARYAFHACPKVAM